MLDTWVFMFGHLGGRLDLHVGPLMLETWEGGWDSGSSCCTLGMEAGIVDLHVGHLQGMLGGSSFMLDTWEGGWDVGLETGVVDPHVGLG